MLRMLGLSPIARALVGVVVVAIGIGTHRLLLTVVGAVVLVVSAVALVSGTNTRNRRDGR